MDGRFIYWKLSQLLASISVFPFHTQASLTPGMTFTLDNLLEVPTSSVAQEVVCSILKQTVCGSQGGGWVYRDSFDIHVA